MPQMRPSCGGNPYGKKTGMTSSGLFLVHLPDGRRRVAELADVYYLEAGGGDTLVRLRGKRRLRDVRRLAELEALLTPHGFVRAHRSFLVNPRRVRELRPRSESRGWELVLEPPVNKVLPVSEERVEALTAAYV